LKFFTQRREDC